MDEAALRVAIVLGAESWLGTPYHAHARIRGRAGGVDCINLLAEVYGTLLLVPLDACPSYYPVDWHLHHTTELYLDGVAKYAREFDGPPLAGDVVLFKTGRAFGHAAIVTDWPNGIHASSKDRVVTRADLMQDWLTGRDRRYFTFF